jgi:hypothetical protein
MVGLQVTGVLDPQSSPPRAQEAMIDQIIAGAKRTSTRRKRGGSTLIP